MTLSKTDKKRLNECEASMYRLRSTFKQGDNRYGPYGQNVRDAFARWAKVYTEITGKPAPSIYD